MIGKGEIDLRRKNLDMHYTCEEGSETGCASPPKGWCTRRIPPIGKFEGFAERILSVLDPLLRTNPHGYDVAASRDVGIDLHEAVLPANLRTADITNLVGALQIEKYTLQMKRIGNPQDSQTFAVIQGGKSPTISTPSPGLYRVMLFGTSGEFTGSDAWVLVVDQEHFVSISQWFAQAVDITNRWHPEVTDDVIRRVRRACLDALWNDKVRTQ